MKEVTKHRLQAALRGAFWRVRDTLARPTAPLRSFPDYLIVGGQRCGTTSLQELIASHPQVKPPFLRKGIHYFDTGMHRDPTWYRSVFPYRRSARITGEASPYYLFHPFVPERISALIPDVRIIALLRDPVERAISHYKHEVRRGFEDLEMMAAFEKEEERLRGEVERMASDPTYVSFTHQHHSYQARGDYVEQLDRYMEHFHPSQVLVLEAERFWTDPEPALKSVFDFLSLDAWTPPEVPHLNATKPASVPESVRRYLEDRFREGNARLLEKYGIGAEWS